MFAYDHIGHEYLHHSMRDISLWELYAPWFVLQPPTGAGSAAFDAAYVDYLANDWFAPQHLHYKTHHNNSVALP